MILLISTIWIICALIAIYIMYKELSGLLLDICIYCVIGGPIAAIIAFIIGQKTNKIR
jgi:hypothetical protein